MDWIVISKMLIAVFKSYCVIYYNFGTLSFPMQPADTPFYLLKAQKEEAKCRIATTTEVHLVNRRFVNDSTLSR